MVTVVSGMTGCQQLEVEKYGNDPRLYFFKGNYNLGEFIQGDSVIHSFFLEPEGKMRDTVWVEVRTMGYLESFPRSFRIVQANAGEADAAVAGTHYVGFDDPSVAGLMKIPANAYRYHMPVILLRDPSLDTKTIRIRMAVAVNENFGVGLDTLSHFLVTTTSVPAKPLTWDSGPGWKYAFGAWGAKKMWFVMKYVGITDFDDVSGLRDMSYSSYLKTLAQDELKKYNSDENNEELHEADGTKVQF